MYKKNKLIFLGILLFSLIIVLVWFRDGKILGGGEEALAFWNIPRSFNLFRHPWVEMGLGVPWVLYLPKIPLLFILSIIPAFNVVWLKQAIFFFISIFLGVWSSYVFALELTGKKNILPAVSTAVFYFFNLYTVSQVFGRFVYQTMLAWGYLPLFLYLILKIVRTGKKENYLFLLLSAFVFSYVFVQPAYILTFWLSAFLIFLIEVFVSKNKKIVFNRFAITLLLWLVTNIWWIYPYITIGPGSLAGISDKKFNFDSLVGVSTYFRNSDIFILRQKYYFGEGGPFYLIYKGFINNILSIIILVTGIIGWYATKGKQYRLHLTIVPVVAWFICKGVNRPFGYAFYYYLFENFPITYLYRNPYEKLGILWVFCYALLFGLGVGYIYQIAKNRYLKTGTFLSLLFVSVFLGRPLLTGDIIPQSRKITVPEYYKEANLRIVQDGAKGRILMMPVINSEGVRYSWYDGAEPSEFLFDKNIIGRVLIFEKQHDNKYLEVYNSNPGQIHFYELLDEINVSYLIYNYDLILSSEEMNKNANVKENLEKSNLLTKLGDYGKLSIYKYSGNSGDVITAEGENSPKISYIKKSPLRYEVKVDGASYSYELIFKTLFNENWVARINGVELENHGMVYGYANVWNIENKGNYSIDITFKVWPWN